VVVGRGRSRCAVVLAHHRDFAVAYDDLALFDLDMAGPDCLDLPAFKHQTGLEAVFNEVIVGCLAVVDNAHESKVGIVEGKINTFYPLTAIDAYSSTLRTRPIQPGADVRLGGRCREIP